MQRANIVGEGMPPAVSERTEMAGPAFNELDKTWNRVFRTMYLAKVRPDDEHGVWRIWCIDHDGMIMAEERVPLSLSIEEALDAAQALCPVGAW